MTTAIRGAGLGPSDSSQAGSLLPGGRCGPDPSERFPGDQEEADDHLEGVLHAKVCWSTRRRAPAALVCDFLNIAATISTERLPATWAWPHLGETVHRGPER
jgi:hypothetical protein